MNSFFKKKIKKAVIIFRGSPAKSEAQKASQWMKKQGASVTAFSSFDAGLSVKEAADFILVIGGDGTYLSAVRAIQQKKIPFLGVNAGSLGFLTIHPKESMTKCLKKTFEGGMKLEKRSLIEVFLEKNGRLKKCGEALNDVVVERGEVSQLIDIAVFLKEKQIYSLKSDGLIVSSATGSTAYNLAAGGPILYPAVCAFIVTPICPHSLTHRPVLFPDSMTLKFQVKNSSKKEVLLTVDGRKQDRIPHLSHVIIKKSKQTHWALRDPQHSNFIFLKDKLNFFERSV